MKRYKSFFKEMSSPNVSYIVSAINQEIDKAKLRSRSDRDLKSYHLSYKDYLQDYVEGNIAPSDVAELATKKADIMDDSVEAAQIQSALFIMKVVRKAIESVQVKRYDRFFEDQENILYHGTLSKNILSIKKNGLITNADNFKHIHGFSTEGQISLSTNYNDAFYYASLFANHNPITVLVVKLDKSFSLYKGLSDIEKVVKTNIDKKYIKGAFNKASFIKLNDLDPNTNNINYDLLKGSDKTVALRYYGESQEGYIRFFEDSEFTNKDESLLIEWFIGSLQKNNMTNNILPTFIKISKKYPIKENKKLYRSIRIPLQDIEEKSIIDVFVSKPGVLLSSWTDNFKSALDIFNNSQFYDVIQGYSSIIVSCNIPSTNIIASYKTIKCIIEENNFIKLKNFFNRWSKEREYIVYNKNKFTCKVVHSIK